MTTKKRVAIYARRSDESGIRDRSLPDQVRECRRWAEEHGHRVVEPSYEETRSGVNGAGRPVFVRMIEDAEREPRPFDIVLVLDVSRFGRADVDETGYWRHRLRVAGVEVAYVLDGDKLTGETGEIVGSVLQIGARDQSRKTGYKVCLGQYSAIERGLWPGGRRPYGYTLVRRPDWDRAGRKDTTLAIEEREAAVVRRIFKDYESGVSPTMIAGALNVDAVPAPHGGAWWRATVIRILANPLHAGDLVRNQKRRGLRGRRQQAHFYHLAATPVPVTTPAQPIIRRDVFPAIVTRKQYDRVQARFDERATTRTGGQPHLLSGILRCGACGGPLSVVTGYNNSRGRMSYYGCARTRQFGPSKMRAQCGRVSLRADRAEPEILNVVRARVSRFSPEALTEQLRKALPAAPRVDLSALEKRRQQRAARRDGLLLSEQSNEFLKSGLAKLAEEDARLAKQIDGASADAPAIDVESAVASLIEAARRLAAGPGEHGVEVLRETLKLFVKAATVPPRSPNVNARKPKPVTVELYTTLGAASIATRQLLRRTIFDGS